jgi:hypothetical protein
MLAVVGLGSAAILFAPRDARAAWPVDVEVGGRIGGGTDPHVGIITPLSLGLGVRGGAIYKHVYAGVELTYYLGDHGTKGPERSAANALQTGFELGYGIDFSVFTIRPQLGLGNITFKNTVESATPQGGTQENIDTHGHFFLEPGVVALAVFGIGYTGADANVLVLPGNDTTAAAFTAHWQFGFRF